MFPLCGETTEGTNFTFTVVFTSSSDDGGNTDNGFNLLLIS